MLATDTLLLAQVPDWLGESAYVRLQYARV